MRRKENFRKKVKTEYLKALILKNLYTVALLLNVLTSCIFSESIIREKLI